MKLIIPHQIADRIEPRLDQLSSDITIVHFDLDGTCDGDVSNADGMLRWWTSSTVLKQLLATAPQLRWMHTLSAGVDHILLPEVLERDIIVTTSAGGHAIPIAEFVMLFMLGHAKRLSTLLSLTPADAWERGEKLPLDELYERTVLIIGLGHIGQEIARRAAACGMRVLASRRHPEPVEGVDLVVGADGWRNLLPEADYIVIATPLTNSTRGALDASAFARMKREAYLINIARGEIIDTTALIAALHEGRIAGAALDVLPEEPLPPEHPLWQTPNIWITPHISWSSPRTSERTIKIFIENVRRYLAGEQLLNIVDKVAGY